MDEKESCDRLMICIILVLVLGGVVAYAIDSMFLRKEDQRWHARIAEANATKVDEVSRYFKRWKEDIVLPNGAVEQWSGANSEVLFVEVQAQCSLHKDRYWLPCWTIWARTKESRRYYNLVVRIDVDENWRLAADERHNDVGLQHVIDRALSSGRTDVVKKVGVPHINA